MPPSSPQPQPPSRLPPPPRRLAASQGDILEDVALIENLEETKRTAVEIASKVQQAKETEVSISRAREAYRAVATRGSLVYFLIDSLNALDRVYHYSMAAFVQARRGWVCGCRGVGGAGVFGGGPGFEADVEALRHGACGGHWQRFVGETGVACILWPELTCVVWLCPFCRS